MTVPKRTPPKKPQTAATATSKGSRKDQGDEHGRAMSDADLRLRIEMIPRPLWGRNVRTMMGPTQWRKLTALLEKKHLGCNICGSLQGPFHAHEEWDYKEGRSRGVATLKWVKRVPAKTGHVDRFISASSHEQPASVLRRHSPGRVGTPRCALPARSTIAHTRDDWR